MTEHSAVSLLGAEHPRLLLGAADEQHPLPAGEGGQVTVRDGVLVLALKDSRSRPRAAMKWWMFATNASVIGAISTEDAYLWPRWPTKKAETPPPYCSLGW